MQIRNFGPLAEYTDVLFAACANSDACIMKGDTAIVYIGTERTFWAVRDDGTLVRSTDKRNAEANKVEAMGLVATGGYKHVTARNVVEAFLRGGK